MKKKISVPTLVFSVFISIVLAFSLSFAIMGVIYNKSLRQVVNSYESGEYIEAENNGLDLKNENPSESDSEFIERINKKLGEVDKTVRRNYIGELDDEKLIDYIIEGYIVGTGDKHAQYLNAKDYEMSTSENNGHSVGIGINVIYDNTKEGLYVINVNEGAPAEKAGLLPGDIITAVDGETVAELGYYQTISKIKNGDVGESFTASVARAPEYNGIEDIVITREEISVITVKGKMLTDDVAYIEITEFNRATSLEFTRAILDVKSKGAKKYIFDMRNNPGGDLMGISEVLDYLLPQGPIIRITDKKGNERSMNSDKNQLDAPMVVLTNENTASAAELFTSALRDYEKATIVGTTTYGKGTMQSVFPLENGGAVSISTNYYSPPYGDNYDGVGITPDVEIEMPEELAKRYYKLSDEEDNQLMKALEVINEID